MDFKTLDSKTFYGTVINPKLKLIVFTTTVLYTTDAYSLKKKKRLLV